MERIRVPAAPVYSAAFPAATEAGSATPVQATPSRRPPPARAWKSRGRRDDAPASHWARCRGPAHQSRRIKPTRLVHHLKARTPQARRARNVSHERPLVVQRRHAQDQSRTRLGRHPEVNDPNFASLRGSHQLGRLSSSSKSENTASEA